MWYEVLEWIAMVLFCREHDRLLLVTQGDQWDTQKDMAYAVIGAVIIMLTHGTWGRGNEVFSGRKQI